MIALASGPAGAPRLPEQGFPQDFPTHRFAASAGMSGRAEDLPGSSLSKWPRHVLSLQQAGLQAQGSSDFLHGARLPPELPIQETLVKVARHFMT